MYISIIIPNYNGEELLGKNLPKVLEAVEYYQKKSSAGIEIIVVDDGSTDSSESVISNFQFKISNLKFIKNEKNLGFAPTVNHGVKEAKGEIIILLNTDVAPNRDFLEPLLSNFKDEKMFAVGCMDKSIEKSKIVLRGRGIGHFQRGFLIHERGEVNKSDTLWVSGGSGAFRKTIWDKLGGFNELYAPFYWEDIDLSYRALKSGYKILFEPKSIVVHEHEKGIIKNTYSSFKVKTVSYRNQFIFMWSNITDIDLRLKHIFWLPYHFLKALTKGDMAFFVGFTKALILFPRIKKIANPSQQMFVKSDKQTISI